MAAATYGTAGSLASLIQIFYPKGRIEKLIQENFPLLSVIPKLNNWTGSTVHNPFAHGSGGGATADYATAVAHDTPTKNAHILLTSSKGYITSSIDRETRLAMANGDHAFIDAKKHELDTKFLELTAMLAQELWGSGSGSIATLKAGSPVGFIVFTTNREDVVKFEVGDKIALSANDGTGSLRDTGATATISGVNTSDGYLTFDTELSTSISGAAAGDYIFKQGNHDAFFKGIPAWTPDTAPVSGESFYGMDRSVNATRLAGTRTDGTGLALSDALQSLCTEVGRVSNKRPDIIVINDSQWGELSNEMRDFERFDPSKSQHKTGAKGWEIGYNRGNAKILTDNYCPVNRAYALKLDTWKMYNRGPAAPHWHKDSGDVVKSVTTDSHMFFASFYSALVCMDPSANGVCTNFGTA